jgi:hypothetical protein
MLLYAGFVAILLVGVGSIFYFDILFQKKEINLDSEKSSLLIVPFVNQSGKNDNQYIEDFYKWGILLDIKLVLLTIYKVFKNEGSHEIEENVQNDIAIFKNKKEKRKKRINN